jgi:hypothetical protein
MCRDFQRTPQCCRFLSPRLSEDTATCRVLLARRGAYSELPLQCPYRDDYVAAFEERHRGLLREFLALHWPRLSGDTTSTRIPAGFVATANLSVEA